MSTIFFYFVNDDMKKMGLTREMADDKIDALFMGMLKLCKHEKCDAKWIDRLSRIKYLILNILYIFYKIF